MHPAKPRFARPGGVHNNRSLLKKWQFPDIVCSLHVVTIATGLSYSNRSLLKKWHFLDIVCSVHVVTIKLGQAIVTGVSSKSGIFPT